MPDYSKSKIYKIVCNETGEQYFGSTTQSLSSRLYCHKQKTNPTKSKPIIERGNYNIILCEEFPCENKEQLNSRERKWIEENECVNRNIPTHTREEYYEKHFEKIQKYQKEYVKEYRQKNIEKYNEYQRQYRLKKKEIQNI
jgi:hypothetical protein